MLPRVAVMSTFAPSSRTEKPPVVDTSLSTSVHPPPSVSISQYTLNGELPVGSIQYTPLAPPAAT